VDVEREFISVIVRGGDLTEALSLKVTDDWFQDAEHARVWKLILEHYAKYNEVPTPTVIHSRYRDYRLIKVDQKPDWYLDEMVKSHLDASMKRAVAEWQDRVTDREDPEAARSKLLSDLQAMGVALNRMTDLELTSTWEDRLDHYDDLKRHKGQLRGYTTGFPSLDRATMGLQPKQFCVCAGLPKAGKSTLLLAFAVALHDARFRPLFIGFEMSNEEQAARYDAMVAKVSYQNMLSGNLSPEEERRLVSAGAKRQGSHPDFMLSADIASTTTVSGIGAKIDQYNPHVVFIDGLYLMDDELGEPKGSPAALRNITQGLKRLAQQKNVCIVGTTQVNANKVTKSAGVTSTALYGSQTFAQDCDVMVLVEATDDYEVQKLKLDLNRNGPKAHVLVMWDWSTGTFEELDVDDEVA
jgi:replicative DNA helicase